MPHTFPCGQHNEIPHHYTLSRLRRKGLEEVSLQILLFMCSSNAFPSASTNTLAGDFQSVSQPSVHIKGPINIAVTVAVKSSTSNNHLQIYNNI